MKLLIVYAFDMFASFYLTLLFFLAVMTLKRARDEGTLNIYGKIFGYPILWVGLTIDVVVNLLPYSVLLWELPSKPVIDWAALLHTPFKFRSWYIAGEWTITERTKRHFYGATSGWRHGVAVFVAVLLNQFDDKHI